jgi:hypothetical protein
MVKRIELVLILVFCLFLLTKASAETIVFKSGNKIQGKIIEENSQHIRIDFQGVVLTYFVEEIDHVEKESPNSASSENNLDVQKEIVKESNKAKLSQKEVSTVISQINKAYYNLLQQGLQDLRCEVANSLFDKNKYLVNKQNTVPQQQMGAIDSLKFYFSINQNGIFSFDHTPFSSVGNDELNSVTQQVIDITNVACRSFYETWKKYVLKPNFREGDTSYEIEKLPDGYNISSKENGIDKTISMDNSFRILQETTIKEGRISSKIKPSFISSNQGLLLQGWETDIGYGFDKLSVEITYQETEGLQLPKQALVQISHAGSTDSVELIFLNPKIKKTQ